MISDQETIAYMYLPKNGYVPAGVLTYHPDKKSSSFVYGKRYIKRPDALPIDPVMLPLIGTKFGTPHDKRFFNAFRDAAPDRWGRSVLSIVLGKHIDSMTEIEILTALSPKHRIGGLAFGPDTSGPKSSLSEYEEKHYTGDNDLKLIAHYVRLVDKLDEDELGDFKDSLPTNDLFNVFVPSLSPAGGARPKAIVTYNGQEWIAKFPKRGDKWDEPMIEHACMTLAHKCGVIVPQTCVIEENGINILLVRRFDKSPEDGPRHMVSGFTIADINEDEDWGSYQDLAIACRRYGAPRAGEQIFRRMLFNICCANTDDHPRNHAFFVHRENIEMTPAYDIAPCRFLFDSYSLALGVGEQGRVANFENALSNIAPFGLAQEEASSIVSEIRSIFSGWEKHFREIGVESKDIKKLSQRFIHSINAGE